jgi:hypothetical protein
MIKITTAGVCLVLLLGACGGRNTTPTAQNSHLAASVVVNNTRAEDYFVVVQSIYVAYFGRPADPAGLAYWAEQYRAAGVPVDLIELSAAYNNYASVRTFVDAFANSQESNELYPGDNGTFVEAIYKNLFNRAADVAGKAYWVDLLNRGIITRAIAAVTLMASARSTDVTVIQNKLTVAKQFTERFQVQQNSSIYDGMAANAIVREMLAGITLETDVAGVGPVIDGTIALLKKRGSDTGVARYVPVASGLQSSNEERLALVDIKDGRLALPLPVSSGSPTVLMEVTMENGVLTSSHPRSILSWVNGRLVRQDLVSSGGVPESAQVSNVNYNDVCDPVGSTVLARIGADGVNPLRSWIVFRRSGFDNRCKTADDTFVAVRADMTESDTPVVVPEPVGAIHGESGALEGWLLRNGQKIVRVDSDFNHEITMFTLPAGDFTIAKNESDPSNLLFFSSGGTIYVWDGEETAPGAPKLVTSLSSGERLGTAPTIDRKNYFVSIISSAGVRVVRYSNETQTAASVGSVILPGPGNPSVALTPSHVLLYDSISNVVSMSHDGSTKQTLFAPPGGQVLPTIAVAGERIWIISGAAGGQVVSVNSDGSDFRMRANARYAGCFRKTVVNTFIDKNTCDAMVLVENGSVRAYDGATGDLRIIYGDVQLTQGSTVYGFGLFPAAWGEGTVLWKVSDQGASVGYSFAEGYYLRSDQLGLSQIAGR